MTSLIYNCSMGCLHRQENTKRNISLSSNISWVVNKPFQLWIHFLNLGANSFDDVQIAQIVIPSIVCRTFSDWWRVGILGMEHRPVHITLSSGCLVAKSTKQTISRKIMSLKEMVIIEWILINNNAPNRHWKLFKALQLKKGLFQHLSRKHLKRASDQCRFVPIGERKRDVSKAPM